MKKYLISFFVVILIMLLIFLTKSTSKSNYSHPRGWVISVGDSIIAGNGSRWAGNSNKFDITNIDALGPNAYEKDSLRSPAAIVHINNNKTKNFAWTGAKSNSTVDSSNVFRSGIDFYNNGGNKGQALQLQEWAVGKKIDMVLFGIGGNEFSFRELFLTCASNFLVPNVFNSYCKNYSSIKKIISSSRVSKVKNNIITALQNVVKAMSNSGHDPSTYTIVAQTVSSLIPKSSNFRYKNSGYSRQTMGGCPFKNEDADWINNVLAPLISSTIVSAVNEFKNKNKNSKIKIMKIDGIYEGRRLCEKDVNLLEKSGLNSWKSTGASDKLEWVNQTRTITLAGDYEITEEGHPNYFAHKAIRNCLRQVYNNGNPVGGQCKRRNGVNIYGEPNVDLINKN